MTTKEKVSRINELKGLIYSLEDEVRQEQNKCKHVYPEKGLMDSQFFYARCVKCCHEKIIEHLCDIHGDKELIQKEWNKLVLKKGV